MPTDVKPFAKTDSAYLSQVILSEAMKPYRLRSVCHVAFLGSSGLCTTHIPGLMASDPEGGS